MPPSLNAVSARPGDRLAAILVIPLVVLLAVVLAVFFVLYTPVAVDGDSMWPGFEHGDRILVTRGYGAPERGDVVHASIAVVGEVPVIKRVAAIPGDVVELRQGTLYVNGNAESYGSAVVITPADPSETLGPRTVPPGEVLLMSDNRPGSVDGRYFGLTPRVDVIGRVVAVYSPLNRARLVERPGDSG